MYEKRGTLQRVKVNARLPGTCCSGGFSRQRGGGQARGLMAQSQGKPVGRRPFYLRGSAPNPLLGNASNYDPAASPGREENANPVYRWTGRNLDPTAKGEAWA